MAVPVPEFNLALAHPGRMSAPEIVGASIETGRSLSGLTGSMDISGGGFVTIKYSNILLDTKSPERVKYWSYLRSLLAGGQRSIIVPFMTDFWSPVVGQQYYTTTFKGALASTPDTGVTFSNAARLQVMIVKASLTGAVTLNQSTVSINILGGQSLTGGEWFEIKHFTKSYRAYCVTDVLSTAVQGDGSYTCAVNIRPPLRDYADINQSVRFYRPRCLMRLMPGTSIPFDMEKYWWSTPEITFVESFP